jgi:hypothetical protein
VKPLCFFCFFCVAFLETLDPSGGVDELLFAGIERVAFVADFNVPAADGRARLYDIAAGTGEFCDRVPGVDFLFHGCLSKSMDAAVFESGKIPHCRFIGQETLKT